MSEIFHGFELLLFKRFQLAPGQWFEWRDKLLSRTETEDNNVLNIEHSEIPQSLWFLSVTLHRRPKYVIQLMKDELLREKEGRLWKSGETLLSTYLSCHQFTEFHLDSIFKYGDDNKLPREIFKCPNVQYLSLKYNCLDQLPADIGRMRKLEYLALTNNKLQVQSIPFSLTFCGSLQTLLLDNNLLDALPGFLLQMPSIRTVHRHGNYNYFKATFMWYHTDVNYRIMPLQESAATSIRDLECLQFWAARAVIGSKKDFYNDPAVAGVLKDYISEIYDLFRICHHCNKACMCNVRGYKVITFKNPYLGNTCVPFQHWACSLECARAIEVPARLEQIAAARELDRRYEDYVQECQQQFHTTQHSHAVCSCSSSLATVETDSEQSEPVVTRRWRCVIS